jgi:hypothetical protein
MPKTSKPRFKAKIHQSDSAGESSVFFIATYAGQTYKVFPGIKVRASQWSKDRKGKGNGRLKTGINAPRHHGSVNDQLDAFENRLDEIWQETNGDILPEAFRQRALSIQGTGYTISNFIADSTAEPEKAVRFRSKLSEPDRAILDTFIQDISKMRGLRSLAHGKAFEILSLREYFRQYVQKNERDQVGVFTTTEKHLAAFMEVYGEHDFTDIDWDFFERFTDFAYNEHSFDFEYMGQPIQYKKMIWTQGQASKTLKKIKQVVNDARKFGHTGNRLVNERGFNIPGTEGNKAPIFIEDLQMIQGADFSGHPGFANTRLIVERGFFTALRYSDIPKVNEGNIIKVNNQEVLQVWAEKTSKPVAIPLMPVFRPSLRFTPAMPRNNGMFNDQVREMLSFVGLDRLIDWTTHRGGKTTTEKVRLCDKFGAHDLRRSAATMLVYDLQLPDRRVMPITGHTREASFRRYLCASDQQLNAVSLSEEWQAKKERYLMNLQ